MDATIASAKIRGRLEIGVIVQIAVLLAFLAVPLLLLLSSAFNVGDPQQIPAAKLGLSNFLAIGQYADWISNTLVVASAGSILAILLGVGLAWILYRTALPGRNVFNLLISIPYPLGPLVGALAWNELGAANGGLLNEALHSLFGFDGPVVNTSSLFGITVVMAIFEAPVAVLMIGAAMQRMDPSLEECSSVFGAGSIRTALKVTLPLMLPSILSATLFVFVSMLGAFAIPAILGAAARIQVITTGIYLLFQGYPPNYAMAAALGVVIIAITAAVVWANGLLLVGRSYVVVAGKAYRPREIHAGRWTPFLSAIVGFYVLISLVLPLGTLAVFSVQQSSKVSWHVADWTLSNYAYVLFQFPTTRAAISNSLLLGLATGFVGACIATVLTWTVHRSRSKGLGLLEQMVMLPQAFPHIIFAFGFLWAILILPYPDLYGSLWALLLAYVILFLPLAYRSLTGVMVQIDRSLEEAARIAGAGWTRTMVTVTFPLLRGGIVTTWALLFMISVREVSASIFLSGPESQVLGPAILNF